jgi:hypothetical protein
MKQLDNRTMNVDHTDWINFLNNLEAALEYEDCDAESLNLSFRMLRHMGFSYRAIAASLEGFEEKGAYCDCELLLNVDRRE